MARKGAAKNNPAAVQAPAAASTYTGGIIALAAGVTGLVTALVKVFNLPASPTGAQAAVVDGAFFLTAAAVIGFAWVVVADFRSRALTQGVAIRSGTIAPSLASGDAAPQPDKFTIKKKDTGETFPVLSVYRDGTHNYFLINYESGDKTFNWISEDEVAIASA
jgi:hypothetical protein